MLFSADLKADNILIGGVLVQPIFRDQTLYSLALVQPILRDRAIVTFWLSSSE
jgi:hypothetical protein